MLIAFTLSLPVFGKKPAGKRLNRIKADPNYRNGEFQYSLPTPMMPEDVSYGKMLFQFFFADKKGRKPIGIIPHAVPDFSPGPETKLTWFGHSSYLLSTNGTNILVDPVFSKRPSPFQFLGTKNFEGTDFMKIEMLPVIDIVLLTHDHYDHLDYATILKLRNTNAHFITSMGVGAHLEYWGIISDRITELAWGERSTLISGIEFISEPARHFSGRQFKRNQTLWSAFILKTPEHTFYLGGDSGYGPHFADAGEKYGPFDLALLECGQFNKMWPLIHMFPEEMVQAGADLKATTVMPIHWGKFALAMHSWKEPIERAVAAAELSGLNLTTPIPGETIFVGGKYPATKWWNNV
ncbi:MAG: MBL fold metallo-hydrolase [Pedobacter sp.]|nr:MAG: MBL fold metallo-hydrolase [Pedobacter sp.]